MSAGAGGGAGGGPTQLGFSLEEFPPADASPSGDPSEAAEPVGPVTGGSHGATSGGRPPGTGGAGAAGSPPARHGAVDIARALGRPEPTADQIAVIEAPVRPLLVVAGAGSGKTETMAARVVWLVANGIVAPEEVLGLTFTRKAAGELADRVRSRLRALHRRGLYGHEPQPVTVSTYHAYAAAVLRDHGLRIGVEPGARLLTEAGSWQLADEVVQRWDGDMGEVDSAPATVTEAVLALAGECAEHLVVPGDVADFLEGIISRAQRLPAEPGGEEPGGPARPVRERLTRLAARRVLIPLVETYLRRKREREVLDFGDQVALAARLAAEVGDVGVGERTRFPVVLLDEYQDTSHAQLVLLRGLFAEGHPVAAVGDPHQSIYGWRGASAGNLQRFPEEFPGPDGVPADTRYLPTSWRNDVAVLAAANRVSTELRVPPPWASGQAVPVPPLGARPGAGPGRVELAWLAGVDEEAAAVAEVIAGEWGVTEPVAGSGTGAPPGSAPGAGPPRPTAAVLCRTRSQFPLVEAALRARGLPVEVVGLGGLLSVPEVADLRAALEVVHDPTRGDSLMRLLAGPALRLGSRDLEALGAWAVQLRTHAWTGDGPGVTPPEAAASGAVATGAGELSYDVVDESSLVEALDQLPPPDWGGSAGQQLSGAARSRLCRLGEVLRALRGRAALPLPELVLEVERALLLDVEVAARPGVRPAVARAHLDAFVEVAVAFADGGERAGLGAFLGWLAAADSRERGLDTPVAEVRVDAVQVLTVHAAKGLEWDVVAVTGLVEGGFPNRRGGRTGPDLAFGWLGDLGALPYPLRGDAAGLPHWCVERSASQQELATELEEFRARCGAHEVAEERRLGYVALTRARRRLLLTGAVWGDGSTPREPSRFLLEVAELAGTVPGITTLSWADAPPSGTVNPRTAEPPRADWPRDPLGGRRPLLTAAARLVEQERARLEDGGPAGAEDGGGEPARSRERPSPGAGAGAGAGPSARPSPWADELAVLLAERDAASRRELRVELPGHLSASRVVALAADPDRLALDLRRPVPQPPSSAARRGSAFHAWLERRFGAAALVEVEELPGSADDGVADDGATARELSALQRAFLASEWADRIPVAVEVAVETPIGGLVVRCRIDAVFAEDGPDGPRWDVVDWKTGTPPGSPAQARARAVQLAVYRLAWARLHGVGVHRVGAAFFYAATGRTVRPVDLLDEGGLLELITRVPDDG